MNIYLCVNSKLCNYGKFIITTLFLGKWSIYYDSNFCNCNSRLSRRRNAYDE